MLNITDINNNRNSIREYNHNGIYNKRDLLAYALKISECKFAHINLRSGYTHITHTINGNNRITHKAPKQLDYILRIKQELPIMPGYEYIENDEFYNEIIVMPSKYYGSRNNSEFGDLFNRIHNAVSEYAGITWDLLHWKAEEYTSESDVISYYFGIDPNNYELDIIRAKTNRFANDNNYAESEYIADIMTLLTSYNWKAKTITGSVQGEFTEIIYPIDLYNSDNIEEFACWYFNQIMDYIVTYQNESITYTYTDNKKESDIINEIAADYNKAAETVKYNSYF